MTLSEEDREEIKHMIWEAINEAHADSQDAPIEACEAEQDESEYQSKEAKP